MALDDQHIKAILDGELCESRGLPLAVSMDDVRSVYNLAFNFLHYRLPLIGDEASRAAIAKDCINALRLAAGVESYLNINK